MKAITDNGDMKGLGGAALQQEASRLVKVLQNDPRVIF